MTYIQNCDVKMTSAPAVLTSSSTLTKSSKQYKDCECDSCLCARGHVVLWRSMQLNFEFRTPSCMCVQLLPYPRQDDWICQPPRMLITSAIFGLAPTPPLPTPPITPISGSGMSLAIQEGAAPDSDSNLCPKSRYSNKWRNKFTACLQLFPLSR